MIKIGKPLKNYESSKFKWSYPGRITHAKPYVVNGIMTDIVMIFERRISSHIYISHSVIFPVKKMAPVYNYIGDLFSQYNIDPKKIG